MPSESRPLQWPGREQRRLTDAFPAPGRLAAPPRPNFHSVSRLVRLHEPRPSGKFGNAVNVMRNGLCRGANQMDSRARAEGSA